MDAQSQIEMARMKPMAGETPAVDAVVRDADPMDELLATIEAELALQRVDLDSWDLEESVRDALVGIGDEPLPAAEAADSEPAEVTAAAQENLEVASAATADAPGEQPVAKAEEMVAAAEAPATAAVAGELVPSAEEPVASAPVSETAEGSLEAVELELALQNQNLISLGFEESIRSALQGIGGEMLFQMRMEREDCQRIAAVRIGHGEEQQFALVIMPPGGGLMRVEPVEQSSNPLALITESYASLMDTFRAAA